MKALVPFLLMFAVCAVIVLAMMWLGAVLGPKKLSPVKEQPFECGKTPFRLPDRPFPVKFYLTAMLFVLFDVELVFLFPWATVFRELGKFAFFEMLVFLALLAVGLVYVWRRGGLEWE